MSKAAIGEALDLLQELPDSDQEAVLRFLKSLKSRANSDAESMSSKPNASLQRIDGFLVFTGDIGDPDTDWLRIVREERDQKIIGSAA